MNTRRRLWTLLAGAMIVIAGHGVILYYFSSHLALSAAVITGVIVLVVVKHLGLLGVLRHSTEGMAAPMRLEMQTSANATFAATRLSSFPRRRRKCQSSELVQFLPHR